MPEPVAVPTLPPPPSLGRDEALRAHRSHPVARSGMWSAIRGSDMWATRISSGISVRRTKTTSGDLCRLMGGGSLRGALTVFKGDPTLGSDGAHRRDRLGTNEPGQEPRSAGEGRLPADPP